MPNHACQICVQGFHSLAGQLLGLVPHFQVDNPSQLSFEAIISGLHASHMTGAARHSRQHTAELCRKRISASGKPCGWPVSSSLGSPPTLTLPGAVISCLHVHVNLIAHIDTLHFAGKNLQLGLVVYTCPPRRYWSYARRYN